MPKIMAAQLIFTFIIISKITTFHVDSLRSPVIDLPIGEERVDEGVGAVLPTHV